MKFLALTVLFLVLVSFVILLAMKRRDGAGKDVEWPFYPKRLLSQPEQVLYHRLVSALPSHIVLAQVQVSRVLGVKKGFRFNEWNNRINRLSYDFVVCSKDATVLAVIELDDSTHESASRAKVDKKKNKATASANVRLVRWSVKAIPDVATIQAEFTATQLNPSLKADGTKVPPP